MRVELIAQALEAKRAGGQWLARCVAHEDTTPSMSIRVSADGHLLVHCHAGCDQDAIVDELKRRQLWPDDAVAVSAHPPFRGSDADRSVKALAVWHAARAAAGTIAEVYLRSRALTLPMPPTIRFIDDAYHSESGQALPALVAAVTVWPSTTVSAVQRIFLRYDGSGKAQVSPAKKSLGPIRGGAVRLGKVGARVGLAEGVEDALSAMQLDPTLPCWATLGTANFATVVLPPLPLAREIVIVADNDEPGLRAANEAARRFHKDGRVVRLAHPPPQFKDFNEALQAAAPRPELLGAEQRYDFEERAAIGEHDAHLGRAEAETQAWAKLAEFFTQTSRGAA